MEDIEKFSLLDETPIITTDRTIIMTQPFVLLTCKVCEKEFYSNQIFDICSTCYF